MANNKQKIFISFTQADFGKVQIIENALRNNPHFVPVVVMRSTTPLKSLASKVAKALNGSDLIVPILTSNSITEQWIHQEIGYANAIKLKVRPIVEAGVIGSLKGFINSSLELPYRFDKIKSNKRRENEVFESVFLRLLLDLTNTKQAAQKKANITTGNKEKTITEIEYKTWGGENCKACIGNIRCHWRKANGKYVLTKVDVPDFIHISATSGDSNESDTINYLNGVHNDEWKAKIKATVAENGLVTFDFIHTNRLNQSHPSANIDFKDWDGKDRTVLMKSMKFNSPNSSRQLSFIYR